MLTIVLAYYVRSWKMKSIVYGGLMLAWGICFLWVKETPHFLLTKNKIKEFKEVLQYTAALNGKTQEISGLSDEPDEYTKNTI